MKPLARRVALFFLAGTALLLAGRSYDDHRRVIEAWSALAVLARIQEAYRVEHGVYASTLGDLAEQTNDEYGFVSSLDKVLDLSAGLVVDGTATDYRLNARARDRRGTAVVLEGPLRSGLGEAGRSPKAR